jgi:hypothetical protein
MINNIRWEREPKKMLGWGGFTHLTSPRQTSWAFSAKKKHPVFSPAVFNKTLHALKQFLKQG